MLAEFVLVAFQLISIAWAALLRVNQLVDVYEPEFKRTCARTRYTPAAVRWICSRNSAVPELFWPMKISGVALLGNVMPLGEK